MNFDLGINLLDVVMVMFAGLAAVILLLLLAYFFLAWRQNHYDNFSAAYDSSGWTETFNHDTAPETLEDFYESPFQYDVDYSSETYRRFEQGEKEALEAFKVQKRQEITAHIAKLQEENHRKNRQALIEKEKAEAKARLELEKVKEIFGAEQYLVEMARWLNLTQYAEYRQLARAIYAIIATSHKQFNGKFPIKRAWRYFDRPSDLPYYTRSRQFYERLSTSLAKAGLLVGGGRGGRAIPPKTLKRLWLFAQM